jgi:hypothetical protein
MNMILPKILMAAYFSVLFFFVTFWVPPLVLKDVWVRGIYLPMLMIVHVAAWSILWIIRRRKLPAALWSAGLTGFLLLRILGLGHYLNAALIFGLIISMEYYWKNEKKNI